uniref:U1-C C2H2-type zinc finger domain-containing protein n=1 Tax=Chromera velia CCMP2878 TaxID=1169474 RepID=A0A0G4FJX8_9ALVE|eukprot:Cvel_17360.t1-p1 / transcript=Cvel_17360.t1 / gene=Cvel_17360 / organism=Chromera_velia_CCMP2878 / gene_product=U1 small nuclear ribonucleoprotein C, putative / transcript_product=U1 small nuclear ribonucleoprotein C, putative / location=Cvel_scaffold1379:32488-34591(-) / protein_length=181 / sequence_SO=supercontig / SO=protein_coding / is_pseudo=false
MPNSEERKRRRKFYCHYCSKHLGPSPGARREHNQGRPHIHNKIDYWARLLQSGAVRPPTDETHVTAIIASDPAKGLGTYKRGVAPGAASMGLSLVKPGESVRVLRAQAAGGPSPGFGGSRPAPALLAPPQNPAAIWGNAPPPQMTGPTAMMYQMGGPPPPHNGGMPRPMQSLPAVPPGAWR